MKYKAPKPGFMKKVEAPINTKMVEEMARGREAEALKSARLQQESDERQAHYPRSINHATGEVIVHRIPIPPVQLTEMQQLQQRVNDLEATIATLTKDKK